MSKEEARAYYQAMLADKKVGGAKKPAMTKEERRAAQEANVKAKEDKKLQANEAEEMLQEMKLSGLSEEQAREMLELMAENEVQDADDDDDADAGDLLASVRGWMAEQGEGKVSAGTLPDFNLKVRFQGHVDSTPPDHLGAILRVIVEAACADCDMAAPKIQPTAVAKKAEPLVDRWSALLEQLYKKIDDPLTAADVIIHAVEDGVAAQSGVSETNRACGVVGCLMSLREVDMIEDQDLLTGCKHATHPSVVMDKFIEFLEEAIEDEDEDDDDEGGD